MNASRLIRLAALAVAIGLFGYGTYQYGLRKGIQTAPSSTPVAEAPGTPSAAGQIDPATGRRVLYWHDPMVPDRRFDKPGKSPFMDMPLVPVYADDGRDDGSVSISGSVQQSLGLRTAPVTRAVLGSSFEAAGSVAYNERDVAVVQARSNGYLEKLLVRTPLEPVRKGQPLAEVYVPEWVAAQEEYLSARRLTDARFEGLVEGARQRMALAGMPEDLIGQVEATGSVHPRLTLTAPISGVISELGAREGATVTMGAPLFRINGLATVWVNAEIPETAARRVRPGVVTQARTEAFPGVVFSGRVAAILPEVNPATRTLKARVELANPGARLVPGMFVTVSFSPASKAESLVVPSEAVIRTGRRTVVFVSDGKGKFTPMDVEVGAEANGQAEIRKGLQLGQSVVVSGQFLVDSEASLRGTATRMQEGAPPGQEAAPRAAAAHPHSGGQQ